MNGTMTREVVVLVIAILLAPSCVAAQHLDGGIKAGLTFARAPNLGESLDQISGATTTGTSPKTGLAVGGFVAMSITDRLAVQPELLFAMDRVTLTETNSATVTATVNKLDMPLLFRFRAQSHTGEPTKGYVLAGPSVGIMLSSSARLTSGSAPTTALTIDAALRRAALGVAFGAGVSLRQFLIEGRYAVGLTDIANATYPHADVVTIRSFSILGGVRFSRPH